MVRTFTKPREVRDKSPSLISLYCARFSSFKHFIKYMLTCRLVKVTNLPLKIYKQVP